MRIGHTEKAAKKINLPALPKADFNDFTLKDWSVSTFTLNRVPYFLVMSANTYLSCIFYAKGVNDSTSFIKAMSFNLGELFDHLNHSLIYRNFIDPRSHGSTLFKSLSKSLISNMNRRIEEMKMTERLLELSPHEISIQLNNVPLGVLNNTTPEKQLNVVIKNGI
jgi:hypothetical protein